MTDSPLPTPSLEALYFVPGAAPQLRTIPNTTEAMQELLGGLITTFVTGIAGTIVVERDGHSEPNALAVCTRSLHSHRILATGT